MKTGIIIFAFGQPASIDSNLHLAAEAINILFQKQIEKIFTQQDIKLSISEGIVDIKYVEEGSEPPSTLYIANKALTWALDNQLGKVIILAAKPHKWRCLRDVKKVFSNSGIIIEAQAATDYLISLIWFNRDSLQMRTRKKIYWWPREIFLRLLPFFLYKRVAG